MDFRESTRNWHLTYHKEALRETDIGLVRALYEQRIRELEQHIEELTSGAMHVEVTDETLHIDFDTAALKYSVEEMLKLL